MMPFRRSAWSFICFSTPSLVAVIFPSDAFNAAYFLKRASCFSKSFFAFSYSDVNFFNSSSDCVMRIFRDSSVLSRDAACIWRSLISSSLRSSVICPLILSRSTFLSSRRRFCISSIRSMPIILRISRRLSPPVAADIAPRSFCPEKIDRVNASQLIPTRRSTAAVTSFCPDAVCSSLKS